MGSVSVSHDIINMQKIAHTAKWNVKNNCLLLPLTIKEEEKLKRQVMVHKNTITGSNQ